MLFRVLIPREIEVVVGHGTEYDVIAAIREAIGEVLRAPARDVVPDIGAPAALGESGIHDRRGPPVAARLANRDLFPARWNESLGFQDLLHAAVEGEPEIVDAGDVVRLHVGLNGRRPDPDAGRHFISAHVDVTQRRTRLAVHRGKIAHHALDEAIGRLERRVDHVVGVALDRRVDRTVSRIAQQVLRVAASLHGLDRGARVARHLNLRNNLDVSRRRVAHDLDVVGMRKEPAAPRLVDSGT